MLSDNAELTRRCSSRRWCGQSRDSTGSSSTIHQLVYPKSAREVSIACESRQAYERCTALAIRGRVSSSHSLRDFPPRVTSLLDFRFLAIAPKIIAARTSIPPIANCPSHGPIRQPHRRLLGGCDGEKHYAPHLSATAQRPIRIPNQNPQASNLSKTPRGLLRC
jgi:hypothetical protein